MSSLSMEFKHGGGRDMKVVFGSIRGVKQSNSSCDKWTWKD